MQKTDVGLFENIYRIINFWYRAYSCYFPSCWKNVFICAIAEYINHW